MNDDRPRWEIEVEVGSGGRVAATIDATRVEVRCDDLPLRSSPEAWATALCLPAARAGAELVVHDPVDPTWRAGAADNVAAAANWWGGERAMHLVAPTAPPVRSRRALGMRWRGPRDPRGSDGRLPSSSAAPGRALCFTGGVDSFFSLLHGGHRPTHLLYVIGFDVRLDDGERARDVEALVRTVAAELGLSAIVVRTDLLDHPRFASISWEHTHGAAIAAVGHLLSPTIGTLVIPPSYAAERLVPWGSRPDLDPRWSIPGRLAIVHGDASGRRIDRVRAIARDPLVAAHLRVCWANVGTDLNCGRCEKCVRTMAMLDAVGVLDEVRTLPSSAELTGAIDALEPLPRSIVAVWDDLRALALSPTTAGAIERLLARSGG